MKMGNSQFIDMHSSNNDNLAKIWSSNILDDSMDQKIECLTILLTQLLTACKLNLNQKLDYIYLECKTDKYAQEFAEKLRQNIKYDGLKILVNDPKTSMSQEYAGGQWFQIIRKGITLQLDKKGSEVLNSKTGINFKIE